MNITNIDLDIEAPGEIYAQADFPLSVKLINRRKFFPAFLIEVRIRDNKILFPFVGAGEEAVKYLNTGFHQRGRYTLENIHIRSVFPFNFFIRFRKLHNVAGIMVFPRAKKGELWGRYEKEVVMKGERGTDKTGHEGEIVSFRNYIQGDPLKYVYWKATAKTGELKTKELSSPAHQPVIIDFDGIHMKDTEEKISCVTYAILKLLRQGIPVGLKINGGLFKADLGRSHKIRMLRELALYGKT